MEKTICTNMDMKGAEQKIMEQCNENENEMKWMVDEFRLQRVKCEICES